VTIPAAAASHAGAAPSSWLLRWAHLLPPGGRVLDLACGSGRNLRWLAAQGFQLTGVDRDAAAVDALRGLAEIVVADIETGPWPLADRRFDAVLVTNYLWRALLPTIVHTVADGGWLIYETFADGQQSVGRPSRPDFLLQPGELLATCVDLHVVAYEHGFEAAPDRYVQRIVATRHPQVLARHPLHTGNGAAVPGG
jgi:SAM-dependent methyltransferase